jgi:hypothetical protein
MRSPLVAVEMAGTRYYNCHVMTPKRSRQAVDITELGLSPSTAHLSDKNVAYIAKEIYSLETQIHEYLRLTPYSMNLPVIAAGAVLAIGFSSTVPSTLQGVLLMIFPAVVSIMLVYHFNVASEVAGLAEHRDRLRTLANIALKEPVFVGRLVSNQRRGSLGTWAALALITVIVGAAMGAGLWNAWRLGVQSSSAWWFIGQLVVTFGIAIPAIGVSFAEISLTRGRVNDSLDVVFGSDTRPGTAPPTHGRALKRWWQGLTVGNASAAIAASTSTPTSPGSSDV